jgi:hypothetical protein
VSVSVYTRLFAKLTPEDSGETGSKSSPELFEHSTSVNAIRTNVKILKRSNINQYKK